MLSLLSFISTDMEEVIMRMIEQIQELSIGHPEGIIELYLVGGYSDKQFYSEQIFYEAMEIFHLHSTDIKLILACVGDANTIIRNGIPWPVAYGVGIHLKTGLIFTYFVLNILLLTSL